MSLLTYLLEASVLSLLLTLGWLGVRQLSDLSARRWYLFAGLLAVLILPLLPSPQFAQLPPGPSLPGWLTVPGSALGVTVEALEPVGQAGEGSPFSSENSPVVLLSAPARRWTIEWDIALLGLYLIGLFVFGIRTLRAGISLRRLINRARPCPLEDVRVVPGAPERMAFAFGRRIYLSPDVLRHAHLAMLLDHERAHLRARHTYDVLLGECCRLLLWPNPLIWWLTRAQRDTLEYQADRVVVNGGHDRRDYQLTLLNHAAGALAWPLQFTTPTRWKTRIDMMFLKPSRQRWTLPVLTALALLLCTTHLIVAQQPPPSPLDAAATTAAPEKFCGPCQYSSDELAPQIEEGHVPEQLEIYFRGEPSLAEWYQLRNILWRFAGNTDLSIYPTCGGDSTNLTYQLGRGMFPEAKLTSPDIAAARAAGKVASLSLGASANPDVPREYLAPVANPTAEQLPPPTTSPSRTAEPNIVLVVDNEPIYLEPGLDGLWVDTEGLPVPPRQRLICLLNCDGYSPARTEAWNVVGPVRDFVPKLVGQNGEELALRLRYFHNNTEVDSTLLDKVVSGDNMIQLGSCDPESGEAIVQLIDDMVW